MALIRKWNWFAFLAVVLLGGGVASGDVAPSTQASRADATDDIRGKIVTIFSYHPGLEWTDALLAGLDVDLQNVPNVEFHSEFLDAKRHPSLEHADAFLSTLRSKYATRPPDVLMIADDPAFELLRDRVDEFFPGVPVVFFGLNEIREELPPSFTGVYEIHQTLPTLEVAMELTGARGVAVINDTSETGLANESTLTALQAARPDLEWVIFRDLPSSEFERLEALPDDWPVFPMLPMREDHANGPMLSQGRTAELIRERIPNPMFWSSEFLMGTGVVGGYVLLGEVHARQAFQIALRVLRGADVNEIPPVTVAEHRWSFDARELERFGWTDRTPDGSVLHFQRPTFFERHEEILLPLALGLLALLLVIVTLTWHLRSERRHARLLRSEKGRLATALLAADAGVFEIRADGSKESSERWLEMFGDSSDWLSRVSSESSSELQDRFRRLRDAHVGPERERLEIVTTHPRRLIDLTLMLDGHDPATAGIVGIGTDVTDRRRIEQQAATQARLHALGQLAGGVAHDFNNLLMVINTNAQMLPLSESTEETEELASEIEEAGGRATALVRELLTFGRHTEDEKKPRSADLNGFVRGLEGLLKRLAKGGCEVVVQLEETELMCNVAASHIDQILTNLVVNARDAMGGKGTIRVETRRETRDGKHEAVLRVKDDGEGMDEETRERLFEPFFTTKDVGHGTGLGLSTVYGLVTSTGGAISVESTKGAGSTFELRWPLALGLIDGTGGELTVPDDHANTVPLASE